MKLRVLVGLFFLGLSACAPQPADPIIEAPVIVEDSTLPAGPDEETPLKRSCPENGDGIGGTGCPASEL